MRARVKFGSMLVLALLVVPAFGQTGPSQPPDKTVAVFGQTIHYWDVGSGPVVVLVHGLGSRKEDWLPVVAPLSQKYRLLVPDQIGFGHSDKPLMDYRIQTYVDFLDEFLRDLKVEKASLVGESLGGWISALYAAEITGGAHVVAVEKLVLVDAAGLNQEKPVPPVLNPSTLAGMRGLMEAVFYDTSWLTEDALRKIFADKLSLHDGYTVRTILANPALASERLDNRLAEIHVPTLVVWGKQDNLLPIASGERYAAGIPGARMISFDKCGHVPPIEKAEEFVSAVTAFLSGTAPAH
ncbi:MAG TPA: alpha/beta hydrolase [Candidatus Acidoferrum sp.]|jgi:pimeloyl-ACP methyl ester carboxylesterase|nr:alpha/beta hydrolase [Candidatus Acidoferrum sp.]